MRARSPIEPSNLRNDAGTANELERIKRIIERRNPDVEVTWAYVADRLVDVWWYHETGGIDGG